MISLVKKKSFKLTVVFVIVILAVSGVALHNSKNNADAESENEQITAKADTDEVKNVQEDDEKDATSTETNKDTTSVPVQEKEEEKNVPVNKQDSNKANTKETTTKSNNSQVTSVTPQAKVDNGSKKDGFSGVESFWKSFRNAIVTNNISQVKKMTQIPLSTRGPMDSNPIIKFNQDKFDKVFQAFINENNGIDGGTVLSFIRNNENLSFKNYADYQNCGDYTRTALVQNNSASINMMRFSLINGEWKLTFIYLDNDAYKKIG